MGEEFSVLNELDSLRKEVKDVEGKIGLIKDRLDTIFDELSKNAKTD